MEAPSSKTHKSERSPASAGQSDRRAIPPPAPVLLAITAIQLGAGLATFLFPVLGAEGTVAVRIIISAARLSPVSSSAPSVWQR